ncbi:MAG: hypothetical protein ACREX9_05155 [Gammaproteobacteria bacterium]
MRRRSGEAVPVEYRVLERARREAVADQLEPGHSVLHAADHLAEAHEQAHPAAGPGLVIADAALGRQAVLGQTVGVSREAEGGGGASAPHGARDKGPRERLGISTRVVSGENGSARFLGCGRGKGRV